MSIDNPYSPPTIQESKEVVRALRWRIIPVALLYIVGIIATLIGLLAAYVTASRPLNGEMPIWSMTLVSFWYLGLGLSWLIAGWSVWKGRYLRGMTFCVSSVAACAIIFYLVSLLEQR